MVLVVVAMAAVKMMCTSGNTFLPIPPPPPLNRDTEGRSTGAKEGVTLAHDVQAVERIWSIARWIDEGKKEGKWW